MDGPFAKYHATLTNPEDLEHRSVNLLVARKTKKGDKFSLRIRPHTSAVPAWNEAFQMLTHWVRQQPNGEVLYDATPPGTEARRIDSRALGRTNVKSFFFPPLRDSGSTETAVRTSLRCPLRSAPPFALNDVAVCSRDDSSPCDAPHHAGASRVDTVLLPRDCCCCDLCAKFTSTTHQLRNAGWAPHPF